MINIGVIGATGYTGEELISILLGHPQARLAYLAAKIDRPMPIAEIFPKFKGRIDLTCQLPDIDSAISACELLFLALPHTVSMAIAPKLLKAGKRVIDLSADYRLSNTRVYEKFYNKKHSDPENLKKAVYGLPEIYRAEIKKAALVANPGCYPTAAILGLAPLIACRDIDPQAIIIDAKSGVSGAGRRASLQYHFCEVNKDSYAYKINTHQHMPEINQELGKLAGRAVNTAFVPHLIPVERGILETIYVKYNRTRKTPAKGGSAYGGSNQKLINLYKRFYKKEPFVRLKQGDERVQLRDVVNTNFCDIAVNAFPAENLLVIVSAVDNLVKGAAGQAVQNMNIIYGLPEHTGLI
jgi:N-acetyl-gamma-glutamyl-phosphate reductase